MIRTLCAGAVALALLTGSIAIAAQPTPVPDTPPDFSSMHYLLGTWNCVQHLSGRSAVRHETDTYTMAYNGWQVKEPI